MGVGTDLFMRLLHESGLALRFPRIKAIRRDKTPADIDTLSYARSLVV